MRHGRSLAKLLGKGGECFILDLDVENITGAIFGRRSKRFPRGGACLLIVWEFRQRRQSISG